MVSVYNLAIEEYIGFCDPKDIEVQMYFALSDSDQSGILCIGHFSGTGNRFFSVSQSVQSEFVPEIDKSANFRETASRIKQYLYIVKIQIFQEELTGTHQTGWSDGQWFFSRRNIS